MRPWLNKNTNLFPDSSGWPPVPGWWQVLITSGRNNIWGLTLPSWARVPTLEPIFSLLFMENVPTSHTNYLASYSKGPLTTSSVGVALFSFPRNPQRQPRHHFPASGSWEQGPRKAGGTWPEQPCPRVGYQCVSGKSLYSQPCIRASYSIKQEPTIPLSPSEAQSSWKRGPRRHIQSLALIPSPKITDAAETAA